MERTSTNDFQQQFKRLVFLSSVSWVSHQARTTWKSGQNWRRNVQGWLVTPKTWKPGWENNSLYMCMYYRTPVPLRMLRAIFPQLCRNKIGATSWRDDCACIENSRFDHCNKRVSFLSCCVVIELYAFRNNLWMFGWTRIYFPFCNWSYTKNWMVINSLVDCWITETYLWRLL